MAKKQKIAYVCTECGADYPRWGGQCTSCGEWNVIKEVRLGSDKKHIPKNLVTQVLSQKLNFYRK